MKALWPSSLAAIVALILPAVAQGAPVPGDFDGDGKADLAVDVENQAVNGISQAGAVQVIYGSHHGLSGRDRIFTQATPGIKDQPEDTDQFGTALATGHFNGDRFADLAVGVSSEDVNGTSNVGVVQILYGSKHGLRAKGSQLLREGRHGVAGSGTESDNFGYSLAAANLGFGREDDLAIGSAYATVGGEASAGAVTVVYGSPNGLRGKHSRRFTQNTPGVKDQAEAGDQLGFAVAAANLGRDSHADLAIGAPYESVGSASLAGGVNVLYGSRRGVRAKRSQFFTQDTPGVKDAAEPGDALGWSLAAADFGRNRRADLAIGVPFQKVDTAGGAGAVNVLYGSRKGLRAKGNQFLEQTGLAIGGGSEPSDRFANALAAANFGYSGRADLAVGVPYECVGPPVCISGAGEVDLVYGSRRGLTATGAEGFTQDTPGVEDQAEANDTFGWSVAAGRFRGTRVSDLAVGIVTEGILTPTDGAGAVSILRGGSPNGVTAVNDQFLFQGAGGLGGTPETNDHFGAALSGPNSTVIFD